MSVISTLSYAARVYDYDSMLAISLNMVAPIITTSQEPRDRSVGACKRGHGPGGGGGDRARTASWERKSARVRCEWSGVSEPPLVQEDCRTVWCAASTIAGERGGVAV